MNCRCVTIVRTISFGGKISTTIWNRGGKFGGGATDPVGQPSEKVTVVVYSSVEKLIHNLKLGLDEDKIGVII